MKGFIELNPEEVILLVSRIKNEDISFETQEPIAKQLLLKLFSIFNELVQDRGLIQGASSIGVTEKELWLMRQYVQPSDKAPSGALLGVPLLRKIHKLLIEFNSDLDIQSVAVEEPTLTSKELQEYQELFERSRGEGKNNATTAE